MDLKRLVWTAIVLVFAVMAVAGPYKMLRRSSPDETSPATAAEGSGAPRVVMAGLTFSPGELTVEKGDEVLFDNDDLAPHTVTADDGSVDSGTLNPGKAFRLVVEGPVEYHCEIHPSMTAKILLSG